MSWFPLLQELIEDDLVFRKLTAAEKVFLLYKISEFNLKDKHYEADIKAAIILNLSEIKIRVARRKLQAAGYIETKPSYLAANRHIATTYLNVKHAHPEPGESYQCIHRSTFDRMLHHLRNKLFTHTDIVTYVILAYYHEKYADERGFFITKYKLRELTNIPDSPLCVNKLYKLFAFTGGEHLFEYADKQQKLRFSAKWNNCADCSAEHEAEINRLVVAQKQRRKKNRKKARDTK